MHPRSRLKKPVRDFKPHELKRIKKIDWRSSFQKIVKNHKRALLYALIAFIVIMVLIPPATYLYFARDLKSKDSIMNRQETGLTLMDRNGKVFYTFDLAKTITYIPISDIPKSVQNAVVSAEDKNFYTNPGFSITGIIRAFFADIFAGHIVQGGSTITQELAKNAFLSSSQNILRKYQELVLAAELNRRFSKQDILEMYLNSVYFGEGAFGIQNAAEAYFGIPANKLDLAQSALLIGILPAPSIYSPLSNPPKYALERQKFVLGQMAQNGYITQSQANQAENETLHYNPHSLQSGNILAPHFALYIKNLLIKQYGEERVIRDGFRVTTTLDSDLQKYAQGSVQTQVTRLKYDHATNGALVALNPKNGQILAMVGSYDFNDPNFGQTNMAITPRQPGSSFKPIIYGRALEDHLITPATILQDVKTTFPGNYTPHDYDYRYRGPVTVRRALANSLNIPAVEVMEKVGIPNGLDEAKKLGITTLTANNYGLSLVLGAGEVPLLQMTDAYATFADQGVYHDTTGILSIKDKYGDTVQAPNNFFSFLQNLNPLNWFSSTPTNNKQVMNPETAYLLSSILSDNQARAEEFGTALTINRPAAVKTGTTSDFKDALTIGYTPSFVVGVWVGNNNDKPMDDIAGSLGAAPIWRNVMEYYLMGQPIEQFQQPTFIISEQICPGTAGGSKGGEYTEYFIAGTQTPSCGQPTIFPTYTPTPTPNGPTATPKPGPTATPAPGPTNTPAPQPTHSAGSGQAATPAPTPTTAVGVGITISLPTPTP
jgi:1A family penicillin-binding protein